MNSINALIKHSTTTDDKPPVSSSLCKCKIHKVPEGIKWLYKCKVCGKSLADWPQTSK